jgi:hypothetical protein
MRLIDNLEEHICPEVTSSGFWNKCDFEIFNVYIRLSAIFDIAIEHRLKDELRENFNANSE